MSRWTNSKKAAVVAVIGLALLSSRGLCQYFFSESSSRSTEATQGAGIDWSNEFYEATGSGVVPSAIEEPNRSKAYMKARDYGRMKACASLLTAVESTIICHDRSAKDYLSVNKDLQAVIESCIAGAQVEREKQSVKDGETVVTVTVRAPMYGNKGVISAILKNRFDKATKSKSGDVMSDRRADAGSSSIAADAVGPFTSLIVDCTGVNLQKSVNPSIRRADKTAIWGVPSGDYRFLQDQGLVTYKLTLDEAKRCPRAGSNPLVVRVIGRAGSKFMCDAMVQTLTPHVLLAKIRFHASWTAAT